MVFIDKDYYDEFYLGAKASEDDFVKFAARASDIINFISFGRAETVMENMNTSDIGWQKKYDAIKRATAAQTEVFVIQGERAYTGGTSAEIAREELGNSAVNYDINRKELSEFFGIPVSGVAMSILSNAGLLYKGI